MFAAKATGLFKHYPVIAMALEIPECTRNAQLLYLTGELKDSPGSFDGLIAVVARRLVCAAPQLGEYQDDPTNVR